METIFAPATPVGKSALSVIRTSGPLSIKISEEACSFGNPKPNQSKLVNYMALNGKLIDQIVITYYKKGRSYTGEEALEISCHGNPLIVDLICEDLMNRGCRLALPGEFTKLAFLNGKINLTEAESVAQVISAHSIQALDAANRTIQGELSSTLKRIQEELIEIQAQIEAYIDFPEDDIGSPDQSWISDKINKLTKQLQILLEQANKVDLLERNIRVVLVGPPNAGKSSLFNQLIGTSRALVHENAGTTRDYLEKDIRIGNHIITLVDTAGIHQTNNEIESAGVKLSSKQANSADIILCIGDCTLPYPSQFSKDFDNLITQKPVIFVENKSDLAIKKQDVIPFEVYCTRNISCKTGDGIKELTSTLDDLIKDTFSSSENSPFYIGKRLKGLTQDCLKNLLDIKEKLETNTGFEILSPILKFARENIDEMIGYKTNEDILDKLFASFCIGK
jgi:tRNA modification GTPase